MLESPPSHTVLAASWKGWGGPHPLARRGKREGVIELALDGEALRHRGALNHLHAVRPGFVPAPLQTVVAAAEIQVIAESPCTPRLSLDCSPSSAPSFLSP